MTTRLLTVAVIAIATAPALSQPVPPQATESEMALIREAMGVDSAGFDQNRILSLEGWQYSRDEGTYDLVGFLWLKPTLVQQSLCIAPEYAVTGPVGEGQFNLSPQFRYYHWLGESQDDCELEDHHQIPDSVTTFERIPTDSMIRILRSEEELLGRALSFPEGEPFRDRSSEWKLTEISVTSVLDPEHGFLYHATFRAPGVSRGPACTFSFQDGELQVHAVGSWTA